MKKFWHIALIVLYLLHSGGVYGKIHFCADQVQSVAVYHQDLNSCCPEDEFSVPEEEDQSYISSSCCKTSVFQYHQEDSYTSSNILTFNVLSIFHVPFIFNALVRPEIAEKIELPEAPMAQISVAKYISSCQLLFYH